MIASGELLFSPLQGRKKENVKALRSGSTYRGSLRAWIRPTLSTRSEPHPHSGGHDIGALRPVVAASAKMLRPALLRLHQLSQLVDLSPATSVCCRAFASTVSDIRPSIFSMQEGGCSFAAASVTFRGTDPRLALEAARVSAIQGSAWGQSTYLWESGAPAHNPMYRSAEGSHFGIGRALTVVGIKFVPLWVDVPLPQTLHAQANACPCACCLPLTLKDTVVVPCEGPEVAPPL